MNNARTVLLFALLVVGAGLAFWLLTSGGDSDRIDVLPEPGQTDGTDVALLPAGRPGSVTGRVLSYETNEGVAGVPIRIEAGSDPIELATDESGGFRSEVPSGRELVVAVVAPEPYASIRLPGIVVDPGQTEELGTLYLTRAFLVKGVVVDHRGAPVAGARVGAYRPALAEAGPNLVELIATLGKPRVALDEATTDGDGNFTFEKLSPGTFRFEAEAEGYAVGSLSQAIVSPESEGYRYKIVVAPGIRLAGIVKNSREEPIAGAAVTAVRTSRAFQEDLDFSPVQRTTDDEGRFEFKQLAPGEVALLVSAKGYPLRFENQFDLGARDDVEIVLGGDGALAGTVTGPEDEPVVGARVTVAVGQRGGALGRALTGEDGTYRIEHLPGGRVQMFMVEADDYAPYPAGENRFQMRRGFGSLEDGKTITKDVQLGKGARMTGVVTDQTSGRPVEGARVRIMSPGFGFGMGSNRETVTDEEGRYAIEGVPEGMHMVFASADGYYQPAAGPEAMQQMFQFGQEEQAPDPESVAVKIDAGTREVEKNLELAPGATIAGVVYDPEGRPLAGAKVAIATGEGGDRIFARLMGISPASVLSNAEGRFRISGAGAAESIRLSARAEGYVDGKSDPIPVGSGSSVEGIEIRLKTGGSIVGIAYGPDDAPLSGARARAVPDPGTDQQRQWQLQWQFRQAEAMLADENGRFRIAGLAPGPYAVQVEGEGCLPGRRVGVDVAEGGEADLGTIRLEAGMVIAGIVVDGEGHPISGARIFARRAQQAPGMPMSFMNENAYSDEKGAFRFDALPPGSFNLSFSADGFAPADRTEVAAGQTGLRITMQPGLEISGRVVAPDGRPAAGVTVSAQSEGGRGTNARTDENGDFTIENLPPGVYELSAGGGGFRGLGPGGAGGSAGTRTTRVPGISAGSTGVEIRLLPGLTISGTVVDESGAPVPNLTIAASQNGPDGNRESGGWARTAADGSFTVTGLGPGTHRVQAFGRTHSGPAVEVEAGSAGVRIEVKANPTQPVNPGIPIPRPR